MQVFLKGTVGQQTLPYDSAGDHMGRGVSVDHVEMLLRKSQGQPGEAGDLNSG